METRSWMEPRRRRPGARGSTVTAFATHSHRAFESPSVASTACSGIPRRATQLGQDALKNFYEGAGPGTHVDRRLHRGRAGREDSRAGRRRAGHLHRPAAWTPSRWPRPVHCIVGDLSSPASSSIMARCAGEREQKRTTMRAAWYPRHHVRRVRALSCPPWPASRSLRRSKDHRP